MSRRAPLLLGGALLLLVVAVGFLASQSVQSEHSPNPAPPELGGQPVPARLLEIEFDRKYDLFCSFFREEPTVYRSCKIIGFTGKSQGTTTGGGLSFMSTPSGFGSKSYYSEYFEHWLVLELEDGRKAYIPMQAVKYIEEAAPARK